MSSQGFHRTAQPDIEPDQRVRLAGKPLSARETEVLKAVCRNGGIEAGAEAAGVTPQTVKNQLSSVYAKLGVYSLGQAAYALWLAALWGDEAQDERQTAVVPPPSICEHPFEAWVDDDGNGWTCGTCGVGIARRAAQWPRRVAA